MKKYFFNLLFFIVLVIGLSGCCIFVFKLDYKKLVCVFVCLGVDIGMEDNYKFYLEVVEWIGIFYWGGGEIKCGIDCLGMIC